MKFFWIYGDFELEIEKHDKHVPPYLDELLVLADLLESRGSPLASDIRYHVSRVYEVLSW